MEYLVQNAPMIGGTLIILAAAVVTFLRFRSLSREEQLKRVKSWLLQAVTEAEKKYGSKTGAAKLSYVYDLFIQRFPALSKVLSYDQFAALVDEALVKFRSMLNGNAAFKGYVEAAD